MKKAFGFLLLIVLIISCIDKSVDIYDQSYTLRGYVKSENQSSLEGEVLIGFKNPAVPDSLIFHGDSINTSLQNGILNIKKSDATGYFQFDFFLGTRDTALYKYLFAYKKGFCLWKYDRNNSHVMEVNNFIDEIEIILKRKK